MTLHQWLKTLGEDLMGRILTNASLLGSLANLMLPIGFGYQPALLIEETFIYCCTGFSAIRAMPMNGLAST